MFINVCNKHDSNDYFVENLDRYFADRRE